MPANKSATKSATAKSATARKPSARTATAQRSGTKTPAARKSTAQSTVIRKAVTSKTTPVSRKAGSPRPSTRVTSAKKTVIDTSIWTVRHVPTYATASNVGQVREYSDPRLNAQPTASASFAPAPARQPVRQSTPSALFAPAPVWQPAHSGYARTPIRLCPHCKAQEQTLEPKCPHCRKRYVKKDRTVRKVFLGVFAAMIALVVAIVVMVGAAANHAVKALDAEQQAHAISATTYLHIKIGTLKRAVLRATRPATPQNTREFQAAGVLSSTNIKSSCIYFNQQGGEFGDTYQFCFNGNKLTSKNA